MAPLSLKIILDDGAITRTLMFDNTTRVREADHIVRDKILTLDPNKEYGFFLASADNECSGVWLDDGDKTLEYYMLRDGDSLHYLLKIRNLRLRMLDGAVKTLQLDESKKVVELMVYICEKLRISHSEEYGLCREETESVDESKITTGTLTLKKKTIQREKDAKLEQLSKKLKTDDLVEWLDQHKTLRELKVDPQEMLLFKRRLFYSDRNVDSRDPVQLNLLYVQTRDGILEGKQVVTETKALEFAGLQCQIQFGDYHEEKHKPGFIQNLKEFLPEQYISWGVEKKTIKEHKKHIGVPEIEAKHLYTKMARELPTYGVTFFLVKEKQLRKKKLVPRLIGINAQSILRLDEETKEIIQVWLLTQVKSYRADYESFALNFGDYSEKEYVVKTNEGFRIKDILEGYIDIIKRSLAAPRKVNFTEGEAMYEDNVERLRGTTIQNYAASKMVQSSLVGPSQIISVDQGQQAREGTQIVTINELVTTNLSNKSQQPVISQQTERGFNKRQLSSGFENTMKQFNSKCVTTVVYLSDPTEQNIEKAKQSVSCLKDALPGIIRGIKETAANSSPLKSKILLNNLDDLISYVNSLSYEVKNSDLSNEENLIKVVDAARNAADLSTQMHLSLDPNTKRRSKILMRSRDSFIQDEKTEASLRRASFLAATDNAWTAVESAANFLDEANEVVPSHDECKQLGRKVAYDLGKLQASIAMILNSHADPDNIDYQSAVMSMKTISEIMPIFSQDIKHLITVSDEKNGQDLIKYVRQLLDCTRAMCMLTGSDNVNKMYDVGNDYAEVSKKITDHLPEYNNQSQEVLDSQNNEIVKLVQNVGSKVQLLLMGTSELSKLEATDPRATVLDAAAIKCTDATECLIACARLTLTSIHEPHSKSALTAATENVSSSAQNMASLWKGLSEKPNRKSFSKQLANSTFELAKTLDKLKNAFSNIKAIDEESEESKSNKQRLKFITTARSADKFITEANLHLQNICDLPVITIHKNEDRNEHPELRNNLSQKLSHLNAAVAALLQGTGDHHSDYLKAETAIDIISKLMPDVIKDSKHLNGQVDETTWRNITEYLKDMLEATKDICANANESNEESRNNAASKYANASGRLTYIYNPRKKCEKENQIMDLSKSAVDEISQMLTRVYDVVKTVGREDGDLLDNAGVKVVAPAQRLLKITEITAPNINEPRCQESLLSAVDGVSDEILNLKRTWTPMLQLPEHKQSEEQLDNNLAVVNKVLNALRAACTESDDLENEKKQEFTTSMSVADRVLEDASRELQGITGSRILVKGEGRNEHPELQIKLSQKLAHLNAAVAALLQATGDPNNSNYGEAKSAVDVISQLTPDIIKDSKHLNGLVDETTWRNITEYLKDMLEATKDICANANESNIESLNNAASKYANASGRLTYIYNPRKKCEKENQIMDLSKSAVDEISQMLTRVYDVVKTVGREDGDLLDNAGVKVVAPAQRLLKTAEITAPNINEPRCQESLLSAVDGVSDEILNLKRTWTPMLQLPEHKQSEEQLNNNLAVVNKALNALRAACTESEDLENEKKQEFTTLMSVADRVLEDASRQLQGITDSRILVKGEGRNEHPELQIKLSQKLAHLNAAVAALLQATGDPNNSNYGEAKSAVDVISQLTPDIIKDSKHLNGQVDKTTWRNITEYLKDMLEATKDICANANESNIESHNNAASKFANASGRLTYIYNPRKKCEKENQIMDLSKSAVDVISQMLTRVYDVVKTVGREDGDLLDNAGVKVVAPAQRLLKTAEITAPNINEPRCQESLLSAVDGVSDEILNLKRTWTPMLQLPEHKQSEEQLNNNLAVVNKALNALRAACTESDDVEKQKKQEFTTSMSVADRVLEEASRELREINSSASKVEVERESRNPKLRTDLSQKLDHLNAAVAALLQATQDSNNSDYGKAKSAIEIIRKLTKDIIKDLKHLNGQVDEATWNNISEYLQDMLEATRKICANTNESNEQDIRSAASKFTNSSNKLKFIFNPHNNSREDQIICVAKTAVDEISRMLPGMTKLLNDIGGEHRGQLQKLLNDFESAVNQLHRTAELTVPSINNSQSQDLLVSAINDVSTKQKHFMEAWKPFLRDPKYIQIEKELQDSMRIVDTSKLEIAKSVNELLPEAEARGYKQLDQLQTVVDNAKKALSVLDKALIDISVKPPIVTVNDVPLTKKLLAQKLGQLNAALASIVISSTDPDVGGKISAVKMFSKLLTDIFEDAKHLHGTTDTQTWNATSENLKTIVNASEIIYNNIQDNPENVESAVTTLANSVALLSSMCNQRTNLNKENQIQHLSRCAVEQISLLLPHVYYLAKTIGGNEGTELDKVGVKVVDGAKQFLKTAQITASTIDDPDCQEVLLSSVNHLEAINQDLKNTWEPLVQTPNNREIKSQLDHNLNVVNTTLEKIRKTCLGDSDNLEIQEKLRSLNISEAKEKIKDAEKLFYEEKNAPDIINKNEGSPEKPVFEQRMQLTQKIGQLNEAMALLLQAMLDRRNPDYKTIKESIEVISNLTPDVITETMSLQVKVDDDSRQTLFEETKTVCKTSQEVCSSVENNSLEELLQGATKYAQASGKLLHVTSLHSYPNKERKILELSRNACERTSLLLSRLSRLAGLTDGVEGGEDRAHWEDDRRKRAHELEAVGITVADAAHALLTNAQITAPAINEANCQAVLISSAERLSDLAQSLKNLSHPITHNVEAQDIVAQIQRDFTLLNQDIADLKTASQSDTENDPVNFNHQVHIPLSEIIKLESQLQMETDHLLQGISDTVQNQGDNEDKLIIEDTPLRQLALKILESVKTKVKSKSLPQKEQKELEKFSQDLSAAVKTLDLSNGRCVNNPLDFRRRQELELAIMDLQQICLLSKRRDGHSNVVDLSDYVDDVISVVSNFLKTADNVHLKSTDQGNEALKELRNKCNIILEMENRLRNPEALETEGGSIIDNMMRIDQFANACNDQVYEMNSLVLKIDSETARNILQDKLQYLTESCNLLRFAAKSSISSAASVEFDENIQNLESVEKKIENILNINEELQNEQDNKTPSNASKHSIQSSQTKLTATILAGNDHNLPKELTRYAVAIQNEITAPEDQIKLKNHLQRLLNLLKLQTTAKSRRIATWQEVEDDSITTAKILEELETFSRDIISEKAGVKESKDKIIMDSGIASMLLSNKLPVEGPSDELKRKLGKQIQKMSSVVQTIALSFQKPEMLSRSLHMALDAAGELTAISKGLKGKDLLQNKRIEEATQEVKMATYNLIKTSESLSQLPVPDSCRKLLEASRSLNEALNKIARTTCPGSTEYCELQRDLQLATQRGEQCSPPSVPLGHCADQMQSQLELINILRSSEDMTNNCRSQLRHITSAVCNGTEFGAQCAYLLSLTDEDKHIGQHGVIDRCRLIKTIDAIQDTCLQIICSGNGDQAQELESVLHKQINQLEESLEDNSSKVNNEQKKELLEQGKVIHIQFKELQEALNSTTFREREVTPRTFKLMDAIKKLNVQIERIPRPKLDDSPKKKETVKEVTENMKKLINSTSTMIKKASCCEENSVTWDNVGGNDVLQAFEALISCVRKKGAEAGLIESEEPEIPAKSYVQTQIDLANTWLRKPASKEDKVIGVKAAESILELAEKMCEDLGGSEKEELKHVIIETKQLLNDCAMKYNSEKASHLRERLQDARKLCERGAVTRVVEAFLHEPQHEIEQLIHEPDEKKRKFLLDKKIAELLAHLARVTKTARFVADTGVAQRQALINTTDQVELLAPALVKVAEKRMNHLDDQVAIENYQKLLANYAESLTKIRDLCDRSVDPIDFSRAAGETIHRIKEESSGDPLKSVHTSRVIIKLGNRVVDAGMQAPLVRKDTELQRTLADIKTALGRHEDMGDVAAEILKKTGEVESALGGENIFQKKPDSDQPIYAAALQLHASLRGWSARHNDAVDGAKLLAVLMARLSHYMETDNKRELIITSKAIVDKSREIANIAKKLAIECTDMRIRTNLLQVCERIPTISGQLKMLTTVKSSSLGQQGGAEDKEAMNMLVGNAQNLMISIQEVVKAAESASVKIMSSQRGYRMKWVQRNYY